MKTNKLKQLSFVMALDMSLLLVQGCVDLCDRCLTPWEQAAENSMPLYFIDARDEAAINAKVLERVGALFDAGDESGVNRDTSLASNAMGEALPRMELLLVDVNGESMAIVDLTSAGGQPVYLADNDTLTMDSALGNEPLKEGRNDLPSLEALDRANVSLSLAQQDVNQLFADVYVPPVFNLVSPQPGESFSAYNAIKVTWDMDFPLHESNVSYTSNCEFEEDENFELRFSLSIADVQEEDQTLTLNHLPWLDVTFIEELEAISGAPVLRLKEDCDINIFVVAHMRGPVDKRLPEGSGITAAVVCSVTVTLTK